MKYSILILLLVLFIADRKVKNQLATKSEAFKSKNFFFIKERTGDNEIDKLINFNNIIYIGGIILLIALIVINAVKWLSL